MIREGAALAQGKKALEVGCGTGLFTEALAKSNAEIIAVDLSPVLVERARERCAGLSNVQFLVTDFESAAVSGGFDAVVGSSILQHLELPRAIEKMFLLLRPGGYLSFAEPNLLNPQVYAERRFRRFFPSVSPDETAFLRWSIRNVLLRAGFEDVRIACFDWLHPATPKPLIPLISALGSLAEVIPGVREFSGSLAISAKRPIEDATGQPD